MTSTWRQRLGRMVPVALAGVLGVAVGGLGLGAVHLVSASTPTTPGGDLRPA